MLHLFVTPRTRSHFSRVLALAAGAALLGACANVPTYHGRDVTVQQEGGLREKNPAEIAVAPVISATGGLRTPDDMLRRAFQKALTRKRYTPLGLEYVNSHKPISASYAPGASGEEATLEVHVHDWDTSLWETRSALEVDLEVRILDAHDGAMGQTLWSARMARRFDFAKRGNLYEDEAHLMEEACRDIAWEMISVLPAREPVPGRP